jgi:hypothetical protein
MTSSYAADVPLSSLRPLNRKTVGPQKVLAAWVNKEVTPGFAVVIGESAPGREWLIVGISYRRQLTTGKKFRRLKQINRIKK